MLIFSKSTQYAVRALSYLVKHQDEAPCRGEIIAKEEGIPKHFLSKLLQQLVQAKILKSTKGPNGGFSLAKDPKEVSLFQVMNVFEDLETFFETCAIGDRRCSEKEPCPLHQDYNDIRQNIREYLLTSNLETLVEVEDLKSPVAGKQWAC
ncbi:MAG: Rrf2 family transcriptional regulator [Gemmatimonadetes bacterium]|nr:MAG: Rrf2 family transcriptional regulator [Gemmatimonadota bacterium]